jgi:NAD+ kinase
LKLNKICLAYNHSREASLSLSGAFEECLQQMNIATCKLAMGFFEPFNLSEEEIRSIDLVIVFGGDGTFLTAARKFALYEKPLIGINAGHLGFLSEAHTPKDIKTFIEDIMNGDFTVDQRTMIQGEIFRAGSEESSENNNPLLALNDIVISRSSRSHILRIHLEVDDSEIAEYMADGVIICTPTGSTAYSLAAGGAVLAPNIGGIGVIPICAHSLTSRPLIISDEATLKITIKPKNKRQSLITVQADGQDTMLFEPDDCITIKRAAVKTSIIRTKNPNNNFYRVLSKKLLWGRTSR